jgi:hypothetical protein
MIIILKRKSMLWAIMDHHILISLSMNLIGHLRDNHINDLTSPTSLNHIPRRQNIMFPNAHFNLESLDQKTAMIPSGPST